MGNRAPARSKDDREEMDRMTSRFFEDQIRSLEKSVGSSSSQAIVRSESSSRFLATMKKQLQRKDKTLVKADIVAILVHLKPELLARVDDLDKFTVRSFVAKAPKAAFSRARA